MGDGARDLEALSGPGIGAFLLPQVAGTGALTGEPTSETKVRARTGWRAKRGATAGSPGFGFPARCDFAGGDIWQVYLTHPNWFLRRQPGPSAEATGAI